MSDSSAADDDTIYRVSGRRIMFSSIALDLIAVAHTILSVAFLANLIRLNVYQPQMMQPWWTWAPYWRVFMAPIFLTAIPTFLYLLVFYRRAPLLVAFCVMSGLLLGFAFVCWIFLWVDWNQCDKTLWCPCLTDWSVVAGVVTMTFCTDGSNQSTVFITHVFLFLGLMLFVGAEIAMSVWIHFQYYFRNEAYEANNPRRNIGYSTINSEATEGGYYTQSTTKKTTRSHPHLHSVSVSSKYH